LARNASSSLRAAALVTEKQFAIADLSPDEEMMVVEASYRCVERKHHDVRRAGGKISRHTIRQVENLAKRIDSQSGGPNMQVISTQGARVLITTSTSKA
jgi:hypothetical protein